MAVRLEDTGRGPVMGDIFSDMEKFIFYAAEHLDPNDWICVEFITPWRRAGRI